MLTIAGRVGQRASASFAGAVADALTRPNPLTVIDFRLVDYLSSAGLRVIEDAASAHRSGMLILADVCEPVRCALDLGGLLSRVVIEPSRADAIARARRAMAG